MEIISMAKKKVEEKIEEVEEVLEEDSELCSEDERVCSETKKGSKITKLDDLPGIGPVTIDKLKEAGFEDLMSIAVASAGILSDVAGITESTANKAIAAARSALDLGFTTAEEVDNKRKSVTKITTGSVEFDKLIGGGIESQGITECFGEFGCVTADTKITMADGSMTDIGNIAKNCAVGIHPINLPITTWFNNKLSKTFANNLFVYECDKVLSIKLSDGRNIKVTPNHPLMTPNGWKRASELKQNEWLIVEWDNNFSSELVNLNTEVSISKCAKSKKIILPNQLDKNLAKIIGYLLGEGWYEKTYVGSLARISFASKTTELLNAWKECVNQTFLIKPRVRIKKDEPTITLDINSVKVGEFLKQFDGLLETAKNKKVPEQIFHSPKDVVAEFLAAFYDCEGCMRYDISKRKREISWQRKDDTYNKNKYNMCNGTRDIELRSSSPKLLQDIQLLLSKFQIRTYITKDITKRDGKSFTGYKLHVSKRRDIEIFQKEIGIRTIRLKDKINKSISTYQRYLKVPLHNLLSIKEITEEHTPDGKVYDIEVPQTHSFLANNIVSHNSGKSQMAMQLAVNVQLPLDKGGLDGYCVFIDTENTFRPERIKQIAAAKGLDPEAVMKKIMVARAYTSDHQMLLAEKVKDLIKEKNLPIKLIIVDSMTGLFRSEYVGRGTLAGRQQKLNRHIHTLQKLADVHNLAIYITNQVMSKPDVFFGNPTAAIGGHVLAHACLTGDSLIQLSTGAILPINTLGEIDTVLSNTFNEMRLKPARCSLHSCRTDIKEIYNIDTGNQIKTSANHRFFKICGFGINDTFAKDLGVGDYLAHANKLNITGQIQKLPKIKVPQLVTLTPEGVNLLKQELTRIGIKRSDLCNNLNINYRQLRRVLNQNYATSIETMYNLVDYGITNMLMNNIQQYTSQKHRAITMPEELAPELCQILGYVLGDGNLHGTSIRMRDERLDILNTYNELFNKVFGLVGNITKIKNKNCYNLSINSAVVNELFKKLMSELWLYVSKSPDEQIRAFIMGFVDAEGSVDKKLAKITISQKDKTVLKYIQMLLCRFGIRSRLYTQKSNNKKSSILYIFGKDAIKYANEIGLSAKDKIKLLDKWVKHYENTYVKEIVPIKRKDIWNLLKSANIYPSKVIKSRPASYKYINQAELKNVVSALLEANLNREQADKLNFLLSLSNEDIRWEKIRRISTTKNNEPVYDLEIPEKENYIANGFLVHNSQFRLYLRKGKAGKRIARLIDSPYLPEGEAVFKVSEKGIEDA